MTIYRVARLGTCLRPLFHTSLGSVRRYSTGPTPKSPLSQKFQNLIKTFAQSFEKAVPSKTPYFLAAGIACLSSYWLFNSLRNQLVKEKSSHEISEAAVENKLQPDELNISTAPEIQYADSQKFPSSLSQLKLLNTDIGGSTGPQLVQDEQGNKYIQKASGTLLTPGHVRAEYHTNKAYKALGIDVPEVALYHAISGERIQEGQEIKSDHPVMLRRFVTGISIEEYLGSQKKSKAALKEVQDLAKKGFVADCLLANWDVVGLSWDNMLIDVNSKVLWRVDNGSGLDHRAQGKIKKTQFFTPHIQEFKTLRNPKINPNTALLFETLTNAEIIQQIDDILPRKEAFLATIPAHLKKIMENRFDYLTIYRQILHRDTPLLPSIPLDPTVV